jgi:AbrB family looped-hinge helix DNA binding protein
MPSLRSKLNAQGRAAIPAEIRRELGIRPGSVLEWQIEGDAVVVRRVRYTSEDIHRALFPKRPRAHSLEEFEEGIANYIQEKHGSR